MGPRWPIHKIIVSVAVFTVCLGTTASFYPWKYSIAMAAAIAFLIPFAGRLYAVPLLIALGSLFGNKPGAPLVEFYDLALIAVALYYATCWRSNEPLLRSYGNAGGSIIKLFIIAMLFSFMGAYGLIESFEGYKLLPFHFLAAHDWLPHYSVKILVINLVIIYLVTSWLYSVKELGIPTYSLTFALMLPLLVALCEALIPGIPSALDKFHWAISGHVDRSLNHFASLNSLAPASDYSVNSLFWNRSWFSVYTVSSLPLFGLALIALPVNRRYTGIRFEVAFALFALVILYIGMIVGSRAGLISIALFLMTAYSLRIEKMRKPIIMWVSVIISFAMIFLLIGIALSPYGSSILGLRAELFRGAVLLWRESPFTGGGIESFGFWNDYLLRGLGYQRQYSSSHNFYLQVASGMGAFGLATLLSLIVYSLHCTISKFCRTEGIHHPGRILFSGTIAVIVYGCFQEWWYIRIVQLNWWIMILVPILLWSNHDREAKRSKPGSRSALLPALLLSAVFILSLLFGIRRLDQHLAFENVGHLEPVSAKDQDDRTKWRYPLLEGDGRLPQMKDGKIIEWRFNCTSNASLSGPPDPRKICGYKYVEKSELLERLPPAQ